MTDKRCLLSTVQELRNSETEESVSGFRRNDRRSDKPKFELKKRKWYEPIFERRERIFKQYQPNIFFDEAFRFFFREYPEEIEKKKWYLFDF